MIHRLSSSADSVDASQPADAVLRHSHERALAALEPLDFPSITSLPPVKGWSRTTLDVPTVRKALRHLVTIEPDKHYPDQHFYRCIGLGRVDGFMPYDGCGMTEDDALMSYMQNLMLSSPTDFTHNGKRLEWVEDYRQFHELG